MKLSLFLMVWNTSHLMGRTLETLKKQTMDDWELLIIDDKSEDDVAKCLREHGDGLPIAHHRLEHDMGMRGNTFCLNYGIEHAIGDVVMWSTPEVMLPPGALKAAYDALHSRRLVWVTVPSHGITHDLQLRIDDVDWKTDIHRIKELVNGYGPDDWDSKWFYLNFHLDGRKDRTTRKEANQPFANNQTVAVRRQQWIDGIGPFPYFLDYGTDDPWVSERRKAKGYYDHTLWDQEAYHQWHATMQYWMAQGKAPNWNAGGHTTSNLLNDPLVPDGGTADIWDGGDKSGLTEEQAAQVIKDLEHLVKATGCQIPRV